MLLLFSTLLIRMSYLLHSLQLLFLVPKKIRIGVIKVSGSFHKKFQLRCWARRNITLFYYPCAPIILTATCGRTLVVLIIISAHIQHDDRGGSGGRWNDGRRVYIDRRTNFKNKPHRGTFNTKQLMNIKLRLNQDEDMTGDGGSSGSR